MNEAVAQQINHCRDQNVRNPVTITTTHTHTHTLTLKTETVLRLFVETMKIVLQNCHNTLHTVLALCVCSLAQLYIV